MTDYSNGVAERNYQIPHCPDRRCLIDLLASMCCIMLVAGALVGYVYIRSQIVALGYQVQTLKEKESALNRDRNNLILEEETLKSPERIDLLAQYLGMEPVSPYQKLSPRFSEVGSETLALANVHPENAVPKRPSSDN